MTAKSPFEICIPELTFHYGFSHGCASVIDKSQLDSIHGAYLTSFKSLYEAFQSPEIKAMENSNFYEVLQTEFEGRTFHKPPNPEPSIEDFGLHTCGSVAEPQFLKSSYLQRGWEKNVVWTREQEDLARSAYSKVKFDFDLFRESINQAGNCWYQYLSNRAWILRIPKQLQNLQLGDILSHLSPNWGTVVSELSENPLLNNLKQKFSSDDTFGGGVIVKIDVHELSGIESNPNLGFESEFTPQYEEDVHLTAAAVSAKFLEFFCEDYFKCTHFSMTNCVLCNVSFYPQTQRNWPYVLPPSFCDFCVNMAFHKCFPDFLHYKLPIDAIRNNSIFAVQAFVSLFGFVPSGKIRREKLFAKHLRENVDLDVLSIALKVLTILPSRELVNEIFGSWAHLLAEANLLQLINRGAGGYRSIASDGHLCLSLGERAICEYLTQKGIPHSKEPLYPKHRTLNPKNLMRADFLIGDVFVEFAGMMSNPEYAARMKAKRKLAKEKKIPWFKLESVELEDLDSLAQFLLQMPKTQ